VKGDTARLVQIIGNLLTNAAKYTPDSGRIEVSLSGSVTEVLLTVRDNGLGIAPELMPQIFEPFMQADPHNECGQGGLGLGLSLVKHLAELHGGHVKAQSEGLGRGSSFTLYLPRCFVTAPLLHEESPVQRQQRPLQILVVDDNVDAASMLSQWLSLEGHTVEVAHDAPSALAQAARKCFDAFILDIGLPGGMDGTQLARRLRAEHLADGALLVALTGYGLPADRERSAGAGIDHHLSKPADSHVLRALLASRQEGAPALESATS
jgi:CheY-like chemotaxis protein